jgi:glycosyltransferase involved in cell wall biosynthesis
VGAAEHRISFKGGLVKVSIVIATYNAAQYLDACLNSCVEQTWSNKEIILIDGASTDGTLEIIHKYEGHITFWMSEPDEGVFDAWNKALDHVSGDWVLFRGADDVFWDANALERIAPHLINASSAEVVCY